MNPLDLQRSMFSDLVRRMLDAFVRTLPPPRVITNRTGDGPYLERYYLFGGPDADGNYHDDKGLTVMLHRFVRSDESNELHSHPWEQSFSFILAGGYSEERRAPTHINPSSGQTVSWVVERRDFPPFSFNAIAGDDFHRVDLHESDCWTLFIAGRKVSSWSFWSRETGETTPWREFIARIRGVDPSTVADVKRSEFIGVAS